MAIVDKYVSEKLQIHKPEAALHVAGTNVTVARAIVAVDAGDDDGSVYRLFQSVPATFVPLSIQIHNGAIAGGSDYDLGLYETEKGDAVDADLLLDGGSMANERDIAEVNNVGLSALDLTDSGKTLAQLSGQDHPFSAYDICLTANTVGTADATIVVTATFATK